MLAGAIIDFGGPIEEKVSGLEGCHVVILYCSKLGRLENAWSFRFGSFSVAILYCLRLGRLGNAWGRKWWYHICYRL